ncbi:hypothetical protein ACQP25_41410 [Microtetraspora malaysiensis]
MSEGGGVVDAFVARPAAPGDVPTFRPRAADEAWRHIEQALAEL